MSFTKKSLGNWILSLYIILSTYSIGAGFAESLANYPSWSKIGADKFSDYYSTFSQHFGIVFLPAFMLALIGVILLFWFRPMSLPKWTVWAVLFLKLVMLVSSVIYLGPMSMQLGEQFSLELLDKLIQGDQEFRALPGGLVLLMNLYILELLQNKKLFKMRNIY